MTHDARQDAGRSRSRPPAARSSTTSTLDTATPFRAYGSIQDHRQPPRRRRSEQRPRQAPAVACRERARRRGHRTTPIDPDNPNIVYSHGFYGNFTRTDLGAAGRAGARRRRGRRRPNIRPHGSAGEPSCARSGWRRSSSRRTTRHVVYAGYQFLFRSTNRGDTWERISADLTRQQSGADAARTRARFRTRRSSRSPSRPRSRVCSTSGTDDGRLHVDDGRRQGRGRI